MRTARNYYEILGVPKDAPLLQIKRRYKQLVRKYHPDVAQDKALAHRLFIQINEAYQTLSDPISRKEYDNKLSQQAERAAARAAAQSAEQTRPRPHSTDTATQHITDAQFAFIQRRFHEAASHCKEALHIDPRNAKAHSILGDIYRAQGRTNAAIRSYSYAMQYNPVDHDAEKKLMDLMGKQISNADTRHGTVGNPARAAAVNMVWWAVAFCLIMLIGVFPGKQISWLGYYIPYVSLWSWNLIGLMAASSVVVGLLLSLNGMVNHPDEELVFDAGGSSWVLVPAGLILLIGSGFFFLGASVLYLLISLIQWSVSRSVLTVFACVLGVVFLSCLTYLPEARVQVLLFGGNVSFLSMLIGWYIGAAFRPLNE